MKIITNSTQYDISVGFEGYDYFIPKGKEVLAEDKPAEFLVERYPFLTLSVPPKTKGPTPIPKIERKKSKVFMEPRESETDMRVVPRTHRDATLNEPEDLVGVDADGVEWVGPGVEKDDLTGGKSFQ